MQLGDAIESRFRSWMDACLTQLPGPPAAERLGEYAALSGEFADLLGSGVPPWRAIPPSIRARLDHRGFAWNGIYARRHDRLELMSAAGPPVCHEIPLLGGPGSSGMCWDAVLLNQTVVASDVKTWPGYVSCDGESGLATRSGMVCPIRDVRGTPLAVWDLDCTRDLDPADGPFFDRLFATLSALLQPQPAHFP